MNLERSEGIKRSKWQVRSQDLSPLITLQGLPLMIQERGAGPWPSRQGVWILLSSQQEALGGFQAQKGCDLICVWGEWENLGS